jgi:predicted PurR-regulated permease PerM
MTPPGTTPETWIRAIERVFWRRVLYVLVAVGVIYALFRLKSVIISLFVAATLAYIMRPLAGWLMDRGWFITLHGGQGRLSRRARRVFATFYVLVLIFVGGWYTGKFLLNPFIEEIKNVSDNLPMYQQRLEKYGRDFQKWYVTSVKPEWRAWIQERIEQGSDGANLSERVSEWVGALFRHSRNLIHYIVEIVLLPVLAFYFALDSKQLKHEFVGILPRQQRREVLRMIYEFNQIMYSFVVGQAILCAIAGVVVGLGLWMLNVKYPLTLGLLAGLTRAIPIIGPIIGGIPIIGLALVTRGLAVSLAVLAFFTILHFVESKFVMPYMIGDRMKLHPVVIIVVLLIGQEFGGLLGMFFAAPFAALLRVIIRRYWLDCRSRSPAATLQKISKPPRTLEPID